MVLCLVFALERVQADIEGLRTEYAGWHIQKETKIKPSKSKDFCLPPPLGWKLVRHVPASEHKWHLAKDMIQGTAVYGSPTDPTKPWSVEFKLNY